jgi:universal stress protein A
MTDYRRILLVVDLTEDSQPVAQRAKSVAERYGAQIELLHVIEYVPVEPMGDALMPAVQIEGELIERARQRLKVLGAQLGVSAEQCLVEAGSIKAEIIRVARERKADLVVIGSRERHGLGILVNFTEDTVLHAAPCDVLAVRLR